MSTIPACSVYVGPSMSWKTRKIPKPEGELAPAIGAASNSAFSGDRNGSFASLAANPKLSEPEQTYLLSLVERLGGFSGDTADVLEALAKNPSATAKTRVTIAEMVPDLNLFSSDASRVANALGAER